jgi:hypothetical protein
MEPTPVAYDAVAFGMRVWVLWCRAVYGITEDLTPPLSDIDLLQVSLAYSPGSARERWSMEALAPSLNEGAESTTNADSK